MSAVEKIGFALIGLSFALFSLRMIGEYRRAKRARQERQRRAFARRYGYWVDR